ncbi:MAG TPA: redoxin domain-containing protein [Actinomycetota bacterium]|jgi:peroxiredoxin|nr:redoxin domain-containing protein [Actinomycetota bacterium]
MQQVVDLQNDEDLQALDVALLSISPDTVEAWQDDGETYGVTGTTLSDADNKVWLQYGTPDWMMATNEPGHTFVLVDETGHVAWLRDYGAEEHGGLMYVEPSEVVDQVKDALGL